MSSQNSLIMHQNKQKFAICLKHTINTRIQNLIIHITVPNVWIQSELFKITFVFIKSINNWCTAIIKMRHFPNPSHRCGVDKFFESQINGFLPRVYNLRSRSRRFQNVFYKRLKCRSVLKEKREKLRPETIGTAWKSNFAPVATILSLLRGKRFKNQTTY